MKVAVPAESDGLRRELGLFGAISMIVGIVIGSGIFLGVNRVPAGAGSVGLMILIWVIAGGLTLMGALTYAELGTMFPKAGGEYVFLRQALGDFWAFMSGWVAFTVNLAGSAAALSIIFAVQLNQLHPRGFSALSFDVGPWTFGTTQLMAILLIALLSVINYLGVKYGGGVQMAFTVLKGALIVLLAGAALLFAGEGSSSVPSLFSQANASGTPTANGFSLSGFLSLSLVAALFAYDGWTNVVRVGSELKNPAKNIPKAMVLGLGAVIALYILISLGYLNVLGFQGFAAGTEVGFDNDRTVASNAAGVLFGGGGEKLVTAMILVSVFGALNGITLSGPRIYYAMSRDGLFPAFFSKLSANATPARAILFQAILAGIFLLFIPDFGALTDNVVFISFFFYGLAAVGLLILRRTHPDLHRPYKVWGYPVVPILYVITAWGFVGYLLYDQIVTLGTDNFHRLFGLVIVAAGIPVYLRYRGKRAVD